MGVVSARLRLLAVILLLIGEWSGGLGLAAEAALHGDFAAPAQHGALPPQVQAMVAQLVETVEALRTEVLELKADRGRSQERAAALETRVGELECSWPTCWRRRRRRWRRGGRCPQSVPRPRSTAASRRSRPARAGRSSRR